MRMTIKNTLIVLCILTIVPGEAGNLKSDICFDHNEDTCQLANEAMESGICGLKNTTFQAGEELVYKVYYNWNFVWLAAGEVHFKVKDYGSSYHITADGRTYSSYEWFYKVRDHYATYIDKETLLPFEALRKLQEGGFRFYDKTIFDTDNNKAITFRGKNKSEAKRLQFNIGECIHDVLSILYSVRNVNYTDLKAGDRLPITIFMDNKEHKLSFKLDGRETKKLSGLGTFNSIKITPQLVVGEVFSTDNEMHIWATDDNNKLPIYIESPVSVGSVKAILTSHKNLLHDLTSKTN